MRFTYLEKVYKLGTVCVIDRKPRSAFSVKDKQLLLDMAAVVADEIRLFQLRLRLHSFFSRDDIPSPPSLGPRALRATR